MTCKSGSSFSAVLVGVSLAAGLFIATVTETSYGQQPQGYSQPATRQPTVRPMAPIRPAAPNRPAPPQAPFQLTSEQQDYVDRVLIAWENYGQKINTFEAQFTLRIYGSVFDNDKEPKPRLGILKYGNPDKGFFEVGGAQPEKWICDGLSLFEYNHTKKEVVQYILPPEERGQSIKNGPLPFLFGSTAAELNQRYWIRALPSNSKSEIWLEAYPKFACDAADFYRARMIVANAKNDMTPKGIQLLLPNRKTTKSYAFSEVVVNDRNPLKFLQGDPFNPKLPRGWTKVVQNLQSAQATAPSRR